MEEKDITTYQKRINTIMGLVDELRSLYIKVGVLFTAGKDGAISQVDGQYPPLFIAEKAAKEYAESKGLEVIELKLNV